MAELPRAQIFGNLPDSMFDVIGFQVNRLPVGSHASEGYMDMRMLSIEVTDGYPFERHADIALDLLHEITGEPREINALPEFG
ncbi:MAG TPA: hypothetical protein VKX49_20455 [Bryobacteraceae bacterium]|nr:hypothetical protein [Bryobacteraceae bacterium]